MIGAGGVGKAVAFGLVTLGVDDLRIVERDIIKAERWRPLCARRSPGSRWQSRTMSPTVLACIRPDQLHAGRHGWP